MNFQAVAEAVEPAEIETQATATPAKMVKPTKAKPLARKKAPSAKSESMDAALSMADEIAKILVGEDDTIDKAIALAKKYIKLRGI